MGERDQFVEPVESVWLVGDDQHAVTVAVLLDELAEQRAGRGGVRRAERSW